VLLGLGFLVEKIALFHRSFSGLLAYLIWL